MAETSCKRRGLMFNSFVKLKITSHLASLFILTILVFLFVLCCEPYFALRNLGQQQSTRHMITSVNNTRNVNKTRTLLVIDHVSSLEITS
jgi:hypothetical protein